MDHDNHSAMAVKAATLAEVIKDLKLVEDGRINLEFCITHYQAQYDAIWRHFDGKDLEQK